MSSRDVPVIILASAIAIVLIILALAVFFSTRGGRPGWSIALMFRKQETPPLDHPGSVELPSHQTTEAPSPDVPEAPLDH